MKAFVTGVALLVTLASASLRPGAEQQASPAAPADTGQLRATIANKDQKLFEAFNAHNTDALMALFTEDLEFFHDKDGLQDYQACSKAFKALFASNTDIRRELVPESLEVYPIKDYGAIETGTHRFCHNENGRIECATFKFLMIWRKSGDSWKVSRVVSYGHKL